MDTSAFSFNSTIVQGKPLPPFENAVVQGKPLPLQNGNPDVKIVQCTSVCAALLLNIDTIVGSTIFLRISFKDPARIFTNRGKLAGFIKLKDTRRCIQTYRVCLCVESTTGGSPEMQYTNICDLKCDSIEVFKKTSLGEYERHLIVEKKMPDTPRKAFNVLFEN
tara:strand:- start:174 stop:665 length:492 start_codon:yes stop_codon:yes gene_type:complete